jgi:hypothetical protein
MSDGQIIEQGTHDKLYAAKRMYRGLVDAQHISAESAGEGDIILEDVIEEEENLPRIQSITEKEMTTTLTKQTTAQSKLSFKEGNAGVVEKTTYSLFYLFKKVGIYNMH